MIFNCPNCGAGKTGPKCSYCGTILEEPSVSETTTIYADNEAIMILQKAENIRHLAQALAPNQLRKSIRMRGVF